MEQHPEVTQKHIKRKQVVLSDLAEMLHQHERMKRNQPVRLVPTLIIIVIGVLLAKSVGVEYTPDILMVDILMITALATIILITNNDRS